METFILTKNGLLDAQVCTEKSYDEALAWIQSTNPAGTSNNWQKNSEGAFAPIKCESHSERTHYMFIC